MRAAERAALRSLRFNWAPTLDDVWQPPDSHVDGLNDDIIQMILDCMDEAQRSLFSSPLGIAILGQKGAGKTHMLCWIRQVIQREGGYFFLVSLLSGKDFWRNTSHALLQGLSRPMNSVETQLRALLRQLAHRSGLDLETSAQITGDAPLSHTALDVFVRELRQLDPSVGALRHTVRALVMFGAQDSDARDVAECYLQSQEEAVAGDRAAWGIHPELKPAQEIVREISHLLAITGPSLLAFDQIDTVLAQSGQDGESVNVALLEQIGVGVMELREVTRRTVTVVSCLDTSWNRIKRYSIASVADRFRDALPLGRIPSADVGQALVAARFRQRFDVLVPPYSPTYPTWPIRPAAFADSPEMTPRQLLQYIDTHVRYCLAADATMELKTFRHFFEARAPEPAVTQTPIRMERGAALDAAFNALCQVAQFAAALDPTTEDAAMPELLDSGLKCWIDEQGSRRAEFSLDPLPGARPAFHVRLRRTLNESTLDQEHWSIRAIASSNARAINNRIENFSLIAGLDRAAPKRRLFLLKTGHWADGPTTRERVNTFTAEGGVVIRRVHQTDLAVFSALKQMREDADPDFDSWLLDRRPASHTKLLMTIFGPPDASQHTISPPLLPGPLPSDAGAPPQVPDSEPPTDVSPAGKIAFTRAVGDGRPLALDIESLRKHTVIFAGSGSGKTVLLRRIVEECAMAGVSAIVLDPNNDLARLGDAWPEPPAEWWSGDDARAARYLADTDVVVWTPRREQGRPISFQPLPDFRALTGDTDEFALALDAAVAALAPRAKVDTATAKSEVGRAVLRQALEHFVRQDGSGLGSFLDFLAELPNGVSTLARAPKASAEMAETLRAAMINDPLFGGAGEPLDPGVLLTPPEGMKARISVISFIGLPTDEQRQSFVNQLQMALFAWIKQHPAGDRPLGGLLVMDEAQTLAPAVPMTACTHSTIALAAQARKYGLGLVLATQAPKGIHNRIVGNAATQFFGFLNSPVQIAAANEVAAAKGSEVLDISRLTAGQFYAVSEGMPFRKVETPMCLSHHPSSALTAEEVIERVQRED